MYKYHFLLSPVGYVPRGGSRGSTSCFLVNRPYIFPLDGITVTARKGIIQLGTEGHQLASQTEQSSVTKCSWSLFTWAGADPLISG